MAKKKMSIEDEMFWLSIKMRINNLRLSKLIKQYETNKN